MFDFLKKKISAWIGKKPQEEEKKGKKAKTSKASEKKTKKTKEFKRTDVTVIKEEIKDELKDEIKKQPETKTINEKEIEAEVDEIIEDAEHTEVNEEKKEEGNFFTKLLKKISSHKLTQEDFDDAFQDLEITLLENNVALEAVDKIRDKLSSELVGFEVKKAEAELRIIQALKDAILSVLIEPPNLIQKIKEKKKDPFVIVFFGINGTGKTTSIAKLSYLLQKQGISSVLVAADTFRAASIEQLNTHAERLKVPIVAHDYNADPAAVAFDAIQYAKKHNIQVVLIDTAGRMYTKANLIKEMEKIIRVSKPDLKIFVGESITGNDAVDQCKTFNEAIGIDGIILSKADVDEKAGTILSVSHVTGRPIYFLGTGQNYEDLTPFTKKTVLKNLGLE